MAWSATRDTATRTFDDLHGVDVVDGAFDDDVVLAKAFRGVKVAFLALGSSPDQIRLEKAIIDGAVQAGLPLGQVVEHRNQPRLRPVL